LPVNEADPDRGINQAGYNSLGQKTVTINAAGDQSVTRYDYYGRDSLWVRPDGNTTFTYLTSGAAKGSVYQITSPVETRKYSYDSMGRITRTCDSINDTEKMAFAYEYDIYGRISRLTYPTGFSVTYHYNSRGYLYQVKNGSTNAVIWQGITSDARGNMTSYSLSENNISVTRAYNTAGFLSEIKTTVGGNARQWFEYQFETPTGNLTWRKDRIRNLTEDFTYDIHDRLTIAKGTGRDSLVMTYDDTGNMLSKSDVGTYSYNSERVHAVENVDSSADTTMFGNQRIVYNYMNLPEYIATDEDSIVYTYGIGTQRIKAALYNGNGQLVRTTWYGNGFERVVEGTTEKFYHWIQSPVGTVALVVKVTGGSTTTYYLCGDNLGSLTGIMDSSGTMTGEYSYDAWGRRRSPSDWSYNVTDPNITFRGYTGHEHLDAFGLIHMNGRIYDPHLARVLNPDPVIQDMENIQAYNRYSYCLNNPLKYIDPSGYTYRDNGTTRNSGVTDAWYEMERNEEFERYLSGYAGSGHSHGGGYYGGPGQSFVNGTNGDGANGYYYDNLTDTYRNAITGEEVPYWVAINNALPHLSNYCHGSSNSGTFELAKGSDPDNKGLAISYSGNDGSFWYFASNGEMSHLALSESAPAGQGGPGWEAYVGAAASTASEMYYSKTFGTWMGKNFKMYKQTWGGNGVTGGKNKFGKTTSNAIKWGGRALGAWNSYSIQRDYAAGEMGTGWMMAEQGTNAVSIFGGIYGAAWGVGWELGRAITTLDAYQEFKFNFWYNRMENAIGPPSPLNEGMWYDFFNNYGR
jgi:RHS repeat-associated protein